MSTRQVSSPHVVATERTLTWTWSVSMGGGPHVVGTYRVRTRDIPDAELAALVEELGREIGRRVTARWAELEEGSQLDLW